jgi:hypothetical protein
MARDANNKKAGTWVTLAALALAGAGAALFAGHHGFTHPLRLQPEQSEALAKAKRIPEGPVGGGSVKFEKEGLSTARPSSLVPEKGASSLGPRVVDVRFTSNPAGALVQIDGRSDPRWTTPFLAPNLTAGNHQVVFAKQGFTSETRSLEIGPKNGTYSIDLVPVMTAITASSTPAGAGIEIDGQDTGKVTPAQVPVSEGLHTVVMRLAGYRPTQARPTVQSGQIYNLPERLDPIGVDQTATPNLGNMRQASVLGASLPAGLGIIDLVTFPRGADIFIEGRRANQPTPAHNLFPPGDYHVELRMAGYKPVQQTIHVDAGRTSRVDVNLDPR